MAKPEWMTPGFAVFNGHVNRADERARKTLADMQPEWLARVEEIEKEGNGIMAVMQTTPEPATAAYVAMVTAFVNEGRQRSLQSIDWTGPATDIHDELVERWFDTHSDPDYEANIDKANEWATEMFTRHAKTRED